MTPPCTVIVFAKAPEAGRVKTRLAAVLGMQGAARLAARMLDDALERAVHAGLGPVELCCAPDASHPRFQLAAARGIRLSMQGEGDLGQRMRGALERALQSSGRALLIGTDTPGLTPDHLRAAAAALGTHPAVVVPAFDGGYALIGLCAPCPPLFDGIVWSTPQVMHQTRQRARTAGIALAEMEGVRDIDETGDLVHLPAGWLP